MKICKYSYKYERIDQRSDYKPRNKLSKTASRIIHDHSHEQIIERIPDLRHEEHRSNKRRCNFNDICKIFPWYTTLLLLLFPIPLYSFLHFSAQLFSMNKV